jgi:hypothetical protein
MTFSSTIQQTIPPIPKHKNSKSKSLPKEVSIYKDLHNFPSPPKNKCKISSKKAKIKDKPEEPDSMNIPVDPTPS